MDFYYKLDTDNNIIRVLRDLPEYVPKPSYWPPPKPDEWPADEPYDPKWQTKTEFNAELKLWLSLPIEEYSPLWDEAKRCPFDKDGKPRFKFSNGKIVAGTNLMNIEAREDTLVLVKARMTEMGVLQG